MIQLTIPGQPIAKQSAKFRSVRLKNGKSFSMAYTPKKIVNHEVFIKELFVICGTVGFFLSVFAILGGIMSVRRQLWGLVLAGGILGLFTIGPVFISSVLSLIAIILVAISRKEFQ